MKKIRVILIVTIITILAQQAIFIYIENKYLASSDITIEKVEVKEDPKENKEEISLDLNIGDITISSDGRYVAYKNNDTLEILDSLNSTRNQINVEESENIEFYKWLNNDNNMIIINKVKDGNKYYFEPIAYNAKNHEEREISDFDLNEIKIEANEGDSIDNVVFSTLTHSMYIKVKKDDSSYDLYYANVMNQLEKVKENENIGELVVPTSNTNAVMEVGENINILNKNENIKIPNINNAKILGTDINDNVYFAEIDNGMVKDIYYADLSNENYNWSNYNLENPIAKEDIIIDYSGKVYVNNRDESYVLEVTSNRKINYTGKVVQSYSEGIIVRDENKLVKYKIEQ